MALPALTATPARVYRSAAERSGPRISPEPLAPVNLRGGLGECLPSPICISDLTIDIILRSGAPCYLYIYAHIFKLCHSILQWELQNSR